MTSGSRRYVEGQTVFRQLNVLVNQFGKPLASFPLVQAKLGEMCARVFCLESAVYRLAGLLDSLFSGIEPTSPPFAEDMP